MKITKPKITKGEWKADHYPKGWSMIPTVVVNSNGDPIMTTEDAKLIESAPEMLNWLCEFFHERPSDALQELLEKIGCTIED